MEPPWPYPRIDARKAGGSDLAWGIGMLVVCAIGWVLSAVYFPELFQGRRRGASGPSSAAFLLPGLAAILGFAGIGSIATAMSRRKAAAELTRTGIRCWGRIVSATPKSLGTELEIVVEAFAAREDAGDYRDAPTVPSRVTIVWRSEPSRRSIAQPGGWCAFLLDPNDPSRLHLDGFATPAGEFSAAS